MSPEEMLKLITPVEPLAIIPRSRAVVVYPSAGYTPADLLYMEQSKSLERGICPLCGDKVETTLGERIVTFNCEKNPVFHEWRRIKSFMYSE